MLPCQLKLHRSAKPASCQRIRADSHRDIFNDRQVLVTPLGALSVLIGAVLASVFLREELGRIGRVGCALCLLGSVVIVLHAPEDKEINTVDEILGYAVSPGTAIF